MFFNNVLAEVIGISVLYFFDSYTLRESDDLFNCYYGRQRLFPTHTCARSLVFTAVIAAAMLCGCVKPDDKTITVKDAAIPTLYSALGDERKITGHAAATENGVTSKTLTYGDGDVSREDVTEYIVDLCDNEGYTVIDGTEDANDSSIEMIAGAAIDMGDGNIVIVSADWTSSETTIEYQYGKGTLTPYQ